MLRIVSDRDQKIEELRRKHGTSIMAAYNLGMVGADCWTIRVENELAVRRFVKATQGLVPSHLPDEQEAEMHRLVAEGQLDGSEDALTIYRCGFADAADSFLRPD